jgi:phospholipid/cholesterol/gamma-HCH transport system substrate-binding protein
MSRRSIIIGVLLAAVVVAIVVLASGGKGDGGYVVRGIFDNGSFMVKGELVRVAGADVGKIEEVDVTRPGEIDSYEDGRPRAIPGKAVIVMKITDPGFQDFRNDATCIIRPQSLIGEKFVDCRPTIPRAPGSKPPPALRQIPDGQPGVGQYLLPLENNSTSVDPDLINNIQRLPYAQGFRLILNELGASLAGRGEDIEEAVKRANPVLRDADRLFAILNAQRDELAQLSSNSQRILRPFARERSHVAGFFSNAGAAGQASSERGAALEASFRKFPHFLRQFRSTMRSLRTFSDAAAPVFSDFDKAAPGFTEATRALAPFSAASTVALKSLGATGEEAGPLLAAADPIVRKTRDLGRSGAGPTNKLAKFLGSLRKTGGWDGLVDLIYNSAASTNGFDQYGHFLRTFVTIPGNCSDYQLHGVGGCSANFTGPGAGTSGVTDSAVIYRYLQEELARRGGGTAAGAPSPGAASKPLAPATPAPPAEPSGPGLDEGRQLGAKALPSPSQRALLDYLLGP